MSNKEKIGIIILLLVWLFASWPLFGQRFIPTHDGEYHLIRIYEFYRMLSIGNIFPRWAPGLNSGYGFPLFIFHYPFPNYVGSIFHSIGLPLVQSFQFGLAAGMFVGAAASYLFIKKQTTNKLGPLVGSILFLTIPYLYVDIYVRGSIGEIWGIAWAMCALASIVWNKKISTAICVALLIISHNIMALILMPIIFLYVIFFYRRFIIYVLSGVLLSAYFWLPALYESKYVIGLNSVTYSDHFPALVQLLFPSWGTNFSQPGLVLNEMSQQIGIVPLAIIFFTTILIIRKKITAKQLYFLLITYISIFFLLEISNPLWKIFSFIQYIQYPWRLLSVLLITIPYLSSKLFEHSRTYVIWGCIICAFILSFYYMQPVTYEPRNDQYYLSRREFTDGTSSLGNSFSTIWTPWIKDRPSQSVVIVEGEGSLKNIKSSPVTISADTESKQTLNLQINRTYFPGWTVSMDGNNVPIDYQSNGLLDFSIPSGKHRITAIFGETTDRYIADVISLVSLFSLPLLSILNRRYAHSH